MRKLFIFLALLSLSFLVTLSAMAVDFQVDYPSAPGGQGITPGGGPAQWVRYIYWFALGITTIAAVLSIVYGGIIWATAGSSSRINDAKSRIWSAILGLILVGASVLLLNIINPELTTLRQPDLTTDFGGPSGNACDPNLFSKALWATSDTICTQNNGTVQAKSVCEGEPYCSLQPTAGGVCCILFGPGDTTPVCANAGYTSCTWNVFSTSGNIDCFSNLGSGWRSVSRDAGYCNPNTKPAPGAGNTVECCAYKPGLGKEGDSCTGNGDCESNLACDPITSTCVVVSLPMP